MIFFSLKEIVLFSVLCCISFISMFPFCFPFRLGLLEAMVKEKEKSKYVKHDSFKAVTVILGEN